MALQDSIKVFCPRCAVEPTDTDDDILNRNFEQVYAAPLAVFRIDGTFTIGTPIEMQQRVQTRPAGTVIWADLDFAGGLFIRRFVAMGALLATDESEVRSWLQLASR